MKFIKRNAVVLKQHREKQSSSLIIKPDIYLQTIPMGTVIDTGRGTKDKPMILNPGDIVSYNDRSITVMEYNVENEDYIICNQEDIYTIIPKL